MKITLLPKINLKGKKKELFVFLYPLFKPLICSLSYNNCCTINNFFLFFMACACIRVLGAAALQKYIGGLGGMGTSGVGSSSSYTPKELNKEVMPEKVGI